MNTYWLRCADADLPQLLALGHALGVIQTNEGVVTATQGGCWVEIGTLPDPATAQVGFGELPVVYSDIRRDPQGRPYWHANLRTPIDIRAAAEALAIANPSIAEALSEVPKFFVTDAEGNATSPANPALVFV